jgi:comEA protein
MLTVIKTGSALNLTNQPKEENTMELRTKGLFFTLLIAVLTLLVTSANPLYAASSLPAKAKNTLTATTQPATAVGQKVNINTATLENLVAIPGIGPKTAENILQYRTQVGKFKKVEDLLNVKGIGEKTLEKIKPLLTL